jgi:hypothetical protein
MVPLGRVNNMSKLAAVTLIALLVPLRCAASPVEQQFAACLQDAMRTYPAIDPYQDFISSLHVSPGIFGRYLSACMRAKGFVEPEKADPKCLDPAKLENEAFCYTRP